MAQFEEDSYQGMALAVPLIKANIEIGAGTAQLARNQLAMWQLRPMDALVEMDATTARLEAMP